MGLVQVFNPPPNPEVVAKAGLSVVPFFQPGVWAALAGAGSTGALMEKVAGMLSSTPLELDRNATPSKAYPRGTLRVRLSTKGMPTVHLSDQATQEEIWSAVLDLVAERTGRAMRRIRHAAGRAERMIVVGGGARSAELCRRKKAIVKLPVQRRPAIEATTRGAAALAESAVKGKNI
jgi:sugar (pentulose or hexulose) kinase